jgi:hypothetical protein
MGRRHGSGAVKRRADGRCKGSYGWPMDRANTSTRETAAN